MARKETEENKYLIDRVKSSIKKAFDWLKEKPLRWISAGIIIVIAGFLLFRSIGRNSGQDGVYQTIEISRGDLIAIVGATGIVKPIQTAELSWETSGRVAAVMVEIGDSVESGEILADLAENTLPQTVIIAQADLVSAKKELGDLLESDTESAAAYRNLLEAERNLEDAEDDRDQWNYNNANLERLYEARETFIQTEEEFRSSQEAFDELAILPDENPQKVKADEMLDEVRFDRDKALRNLNYIMGKAYSQQVAEDFADYDLALAEYQDAVREWERVKDGPNSEDIKAAESRVAAAEATVSLGSLDAAFCGT